MSVVGAAWRWMVVTSKWPWVSWNRGAQALFWSLEAMLAVQQAGGGPAFRVATHAATAAQLSDELLRLVRRPGAAPLTLIANGVPLAAEAPLAALLASVGTAVVVRCADDAPLFGTAIDVPPGMRIDTAAADGAAVHSDGDRLLDAGLADVTGPPGVVVALPSGGMPPASLLVHGQMVSLRGAGGAPITVADLQARLASTVGVPTFAAALVVGGVDVLAAAADPRQPITVCD